jgi:DNA (cytosine-5)-methyltransferase 1
LHLAGWQGLFAVARNEAAFFTLKANLVEGRRHFSWPAWLPDTH